MKKYYLFLLLNIAVFSSRAQSVLRYEFLNNLNEKNGSGPALTVLGDEGSFVTDTLNEINGTTKTVYRFDVNSGLQFDNAGANNFFGDTYSIEIYFVFDQLASWKRVVDWKNRKADAGAYVYNGQLNFYPYVYSGDAPVVAGEYTYYVVTRDGSTGQVIIYTDADEQIEFTDNNNDAILDADNVLHFFQDDLAVPNEASSGAVALLNLYNYVLDSNTVKQNFENLGGQVFSVHEMRNTNLPATVYPNPAGNETTIDLSGFDGRQVELKIFNDAGMLVYSRSTPPDRQVIVNTSSLPEGVYLVTATSGNSSACQKLVVLKSEF